MRAGAVPRLSRSGLAGCATGDTTSDSERIGGTGSVLDDTSTATSGSLTELAADRALLRAGDLPDGYVTHARVGLTSDVIAVRRGAAVALVTDNRFDARRDELRLGPLAATAAARLAAVS